MSDTWNAIQEVKSKQSSLRAKILERKKQREDIVAEITNVDAGIKSATSQSPGSGSQPSSRSPSPAPASGPNSSPSTSSAVPSSVTASPQKLPVSSLAKLSNPDIEKKLVQVFLDISLDIPCSAAFLVRRTSKLLKQKVELPVIEDLLHKFAAQQLISVTTKDSVDVKRDVIVTFVDVPKLTAVSHDVSTPSPKTDADSAKRKRDSSPSIEEPTNKQSKQTSAHDDSIESLLSTQSSKERENKKLNDEILHLLSKPTAKEQSLVERFRSQRGQVQEFCPYGTKQECMKANGTKEMCKKLHFRKIIEKHTDESLGDCSFLNTCFHMDQCKFVHYEIDYPEKTDETTLVKKDATMANDLCKDGPVILYPPQWVQCDLRSFDMTSLGKFAVIMADPPWDIHMELPYGTMSDDEMRKLDVPHLQDDGYIFLWVTGRAMELARECLELWGYKRVDEIIWVKTNQLQRIIRTGRTGHWLNHGKEHCLIGMKGNPKGFNRGLDCDVIVAEVRATSHKPDEIYGIIERLAPGHRKIELFGRPHNVQKNWVTLGNQVDGVKLIDPDVVNAFKERYPEGNCMKPVMKNR